MPARLSSLSLSPGPSPSSSSLIPSVAAPPSPPSPTAPSRTTIRNRRLHYLSLNPSYFTSPDLELADPLLYDRLIRRFQTPAEREELGRIRGFSGVLEADLRRAEAKVDAVRKARGEEGGDERWAGYEIPGGEEEEVRWEVEEDEDEDSDGNLVLRHRRRRRGEVEWGPWEVVGGEKSSGGGSGEGDEEEEEEAKTREEGEEMWRREMTIRFLEGRDEDVDYGVIDRDEELDGGEGRRDEEEKWFDTETPRWEEGVPEGGTDTGVLDY